jgi:septal ring factor EnvC (AmiA/AmiB activator)
MTLSGGNGNAQRNYSTTVVGCVMTAVLSYFVFVYGNQSNAQSVQMNQNNIDIAQLKISVANLIDDKRATAIAVASIEQTQTQILGSLGNLKDATDDLKDEFKQLSKQFSDLEDSIRPPIAKPH